MLESLGLITHWGKSYFLDVLFLPSLFDFNCLLFSPVADIVFIVKDKEHQLFRREGNDIVYTASIPLGKVTDNDVEELHMRRKRKATPT